MNGRNSESKGNRLCETVRHVPQSGNIMTHEIQESGDPWKFHDRWESRDTNELRSHNPT